MKIKTRQSGRTIKTFDRADSFAQKTKNGLSDANRTADQLQDTNAESEVDYAGSRVQEGEEQVGEYAAYGIERMGRWGMRVTANKLHRLYRRSRRIIRTVNPRLPIQRLPIPNRKRLLSAKKMLNAPTQTARMKASQKAAMRLKRMTQITVRSVKTAIKATIDAIKSALAVTKNVVAWIVAGGTVAVMIILFVCVVVAVGSLVNGD